MKLRRKTKSIISGILLVAIIAGVLALAGSLLGSETKTISSTKFSVGGINEQGNYVDSKTSIYTKNMFECQGLSIEPDFEATGTYKVFYYDENKNFVGATDELKAEDGAYTKGNNYTIGKYARVMITPDVPVDEDGNAEEDFKIRFYEVVRYADDYTITVDKKQNIKYSFNDYTALKLDEGKDINKTTGNYYDSASNGLIESEHLNVYSYSVTESTLAFVGGNIDEMNQYQVIIRRADGTFDRMLELADMPSLSSPVFLYKGDIVYINVSPKTVSTEDLVLYVLN